MRGRSLAGVSTTMQMYMYKSCHRKSKFQINQTFQTKWLISFNHWLEMEKMEDKEKCLAKVLNILESQSLLLQRMSCCSFPTHVPVALPHFKCVMPESLSLPLPEVGPIKQMYYIMVCRATSWKVLRASWNILSALKSHSIWSRGQSLSTLQDWNLNN